MGPPYGMATAVVGGVPTVGTDVPVAAVLLALFAASAAAHMTILQLNKRAGLKFLFSGMLFALSVLRSVALCMRAVWAAHPHSADVAIASGILTQTGSVLVLIINLILAHRVVRGYHPALRLAPRHDPRLPLPSSPASSRRSSMVIAVTVQTVLTLDPAVRRADRAVQLFAGTYMAVLAFVPLPVVVLAALAPRAQRVEKFGAGRWRTKVRLLLFTASRRGDAGGVLPDLHGVRGAAGERPGLVPRRACYYCFNYVTDLVVSATYLFSRFDRRFIVPNGARGAGRLRQGRAGASALVRRRRRRRRQRDGSREARPARAQQQQRQRQREDTSSRVRGGG